MTRNKTLWGGLTALVIGAASIGYMAGNYNANKPTPKSTINNAPIEEIIPDLDSETSQTKEDYLSSNPNSPFNADYVDKPSPQPDTQKRKERSVEESNMVVKILWARVKGEKEPYEKYVEVQGLIGDPIEYASKEDYDAGIKIPTEPKEPGALFKAIMTDENKKAARTIYDIGKAIYEGAEERKLENKAKREAKTN